MHQTRQLFETHRLANDCERIFSRPGYQQKYLSFPSVARNKRHAQRVPSDVGNGQSKFGGDTCAVPEIFARERKPVRSAGNRVVVGEVRKTTTVSLPTRMNSVCASQIGLRSDSPFLRNAPTDGPTDRQTPLFYVYN